MAPTKVLVPDSKLPLIVAGSSNLKLPTVDEVLGELGGLIADITKITYVEVGELSLQ
jgi:hypothetical protein